MFMAPVTPDVDQASANCTLEETHVFLKSLHLRQSDFFGHAPPLGTTSWMKITIDRHRTWQLVSRKNKASPQILDLLAVTVGTTHSMLEPKVTSMGDPYTV